MAQIIAATIVCLAALFVSYRAIPSGRGALLGIAAVVSALATLLAAFTHLL
jgi:hypothetical protein